MRFVVAIYLTYFLSASPILAQDEDEAGSEMTDENIAPAVIETTVKELHSGIDRFDFTDRGLSIIPPKGWIVSPIAPGRPIELIAPDDKNLLYRGNIKIMRFNKPISLDDATKEETAGLIMKKNSYLTYIEGYNVRKGTDSELNDETKTVLYYSDFKINGLDMMQAHLVIPANEHHFIVTYTDLARNLNGDRSEVFLETVWPSLASIKVADPAVYTSKYQYYIPMIIGLSALLLCSIFVFRLLRHRFEEKALMLSPEDEKKISKNSSQEELDSILDRKISQYGEEDGEGVFVDGDDDEIKSNTNKSDDFNGFDDDDDEELAG